MKNVLSDPYDHCRILPHRRRPRCAGPGIGRGALRRADGVCCAGVCEEQSPSYWQMYYNFAPPTDEFIAGLAAAAASSTSSPTASRI